ncbi:MAG TPA: tRNA (guanosine(46)-N7)-methyltransferase TrmB, partial [Phycisphaerales bacterium]|nr:tRNA (guanosine(46)-N7)-methyltransferase TrmB [Phycisphaerales bacterium]
KGAFLLNQARIEPDVNFLGIEWANKYYRWAVDRLGRWAIGNVRVIRTDAADLVARRIPDESVDAYHIYFPDPWPKKRHHKRRFLCQANLDHLYRTLRATGRIYIATDHAEYFQAIEELARANAHRFTPIDFKRPAAAESGELTGTNFERKYLKENRPIHTLALRKK